MAAAQRREGRRRARWVDMVFALVVCLAAILVVILLVPRPNAIVQPPVDVAGFAPGASQQVGFPVSVPRGLPEGWRATSVRISRATDDVLTWHAGYQTASDQYAAVEQAKNGSSEWLRAQVNRGRDEGTQDVAGHTWKRINRMDKVQRSLVLQDGAITTIVTGTASWEELGTLAASLAPVAAG